MTENKRFTLYQSADGSEEYVFDNNCALRTDEEVDLLNKLNDENEQLKQENVHLKQLVKKVINERVVDYPLLQELKEMVKE